MAKFLKTTISKLPFINVSPPKNKLHFSTCCFVVDSSRNILCCRRVKSEERASGWGNPAKGSVEFSSLDKAIVENLKQDIGLEISEVIIDTEDKDESNLSFEYENMEVIFRACLAQESTRDIYHEHYLNITFHEIILYYFVQMPTSKEAIHFY